MYRDTLQNIGVTGRFDSPELSNSTVKSGADPEKQHTEDSSRANSEFLSCASFWRFCICVLSSIFSVALCKFLFYCVVFSRNLLENVFLSGVGFVVRFLVKVPNESFWGSARKSPKTCEKVKQYPKNSIWGIFVVFSGTFFAEP